MHVSLTRVRNIVKISTCGKFEIVWLIVVIKKVIGEITVVEKEKRELFEKFRSKTRCASNFTGELCGGDYFEFLRNLGRKNAYFLDTGTIHIRTTDGLYYFGENFPLFQNYTFLKLLAIDRGT